MSLPEESLLPGFDGRPSRLLGRLDPGNAFRADLPFGGFRRRNRPLRRFDLGPASFLGGPDLGDVGWADGAFSPFHRLDGSGNRFPRSQDEREFLVESRNLFLEIGGQSELLRGQVYHSGMIKAEDWFGHKFCEESNGRGVVTNLTQSGQFIRSDGT